MKQAGFILGFMLIACLVNVFVRTYIFDNIWTNGIALAIINGYGLNRYSKKFAKKPLAN